MNKYMYEIFLNDIDSNSYLQNDLFDNVIKHEDSKKNYQDNYDNFSTTKYPKSSNYELEIFNISEGYENGNMFKNLYDPYKHYVPKKLKPVNEEQEILLKIDELSFAMHEINLYLSNNPNDINMINKYNALQKKYDKALNYYESKFTSIQCNNPYMTTSPFSWTEDPLPWDRRIL